VLQPSLLSITVTSLLFLPVLHLLPWGKLELVRILHNSALKDDHNLDTSKRSEINLKRDEIFKAMKRHDVTLKMKAARSSEKLVSYPITTKRYNPESHEMKIFSDYKCVTRY
jgi:hypothetical protein